MKAKVKLVSAWDCPICGFENVIGDFLLSAFLNPLWDSEIAQECSCCEENIYLDVDKFRKEQE
jgi:hypothetical protein